MFGLTNLRLYVYSGIAIALGLLVWHDRHQTHRADAATTRANTAEASLTVQIENTRKEHESAQRYAARINALRAPRSPPARIMCKLPAAVPAASQAASGANDAPAPDDSGVLEEVDLGPRLDLSFRACEENLIKLEELQRFERSR